MQNLCSRSGEDITAESAATQYATIAVEARKTNCNFLRLKYEMDAIYIVLLLWAGLKERATAVWRMQSLDVAAWLNGSAPEDQVLITIKR